MIDNREIVNQRIDFAIRNKTSYLDLNNLQLDSLPDKISELDCLHELNLSNNKFTEYPKIISKLYNLYVLNLSNNELDDMYVEFGKYYSLQELDLRDNAFKYFPRALNYLRNIGDLVYLEGNPYYDDVPEEIYEQGIWATENYFEELRSSKQIHRLFEAKLLFVGNGEVGKTTLMKVLKDNEYDVKIGKEPTTHGINIKTWNLDIHFPAKKPYYNRFIDQEKLLYYEYEDEPDENEEINVEPIIKPAYEVLDYHDYNYLNIENNIYDYYGNFFVKHNVKINLWDFGGQDIYHSTHQFFLTKRSVYLFVWDASKNQDEKSFEYWLNSIKFLSNGSPVIIVMNKSEKRFKHIDESLLMKKYENIIAFHKISCFTKEGILDLEDSIKHSIKGLKHIGDRLPAVWLNLNKHLKGLRRNYIDIEEFYEICTSFNINEKRADYISEYLNDLGKILHFSKDSILQNIVILKPEWATKAVYNIIDDVNIQKNGGRFNINDLKTIWNRRTYPKHKHYELIKLMEKFELTFNLIGTDDYIIPELLEPLKSLKELERFNNNCLIFEYHYKFIPAGITNRLICSLYHMIEKNHYWKNGVIFKHELAYALVQEFKMDKIISIKIYGNNCSNLLAIIRNELQRIHSNLNFNKITNLDYIEKIPCPCDYCQTRKKPHMHEYRVLLNYIEKGKEYIDCLVSTDSINIKKILRGIKSNNSNINLLNYMIVAASQLQGNYKIIDKNEDSRNSFIANVLTNKGIIAKDQSRWGKSETGKQQGELDIKIEDNEGSALSVFEGFNLRNLNKSIITRHIQKIIGYDSNGLKDNFIFIYSESNNFIELFNGYLEFLKETKINKVNFDIIENLSNDLSKGSEIKIVRSKFYRQKQLCNLYHILINLNL